MLKVAWGLVLFWGGCWTLGQKPGSTWGFLTAAYCPRAPRPLLSHSGFSVPTPAQKKFFLDPCSPSSLACYCNECKWCSIIDTLISTSNCFLQNGERKWRGFSRVQPPPKNLILVLLQEGTIELVRGLLMGFCVSPAVWDFSGPKILSFLLDVKSPTRLPNALGAP